MVYDDIIKELLRKGVHLTSVIIILVYAFFGKQSVLIVLIVYLIVMLFLEYLRLKHRIKVPLFHGLFREKEQHRISGHVYFTIGAIVSIILFNRDIAYACILMTTFGDMSAALIGKTYGRTFITGNGKTLEGSLAEFVVDLFVGYIFIGHWFVVLIMAIAATVVEATVSKIDDNLVIPVVSGIVGQVAMLCITVL
ncbi:MAG: SEC59/DGK1/VTE5 family protein [Euryarchaeota archaeon]|nr:SEC59/DGK1/VTE5 family protein [Euryarchaeota archaeon]